MDKFETIADFIKFKETCVFCKTPLRTKLTNYVGVSGQGIPIINAKFKEGRFEFKIKHTTPSFDIKADVFIFIERNTLMFDNFTNGELPAIDEHLVRRVFEDFGPHFETYCPNPKCGLDYHVSTHPIRLKKTHPVAGMWYVEPFGVAWEGARIGYYVVNNDLHNSKTRIYSRKNIDAPPIVVPLVDFSTMSKEKLITRIKTLVTFS